MKPPGVETNFEDNTSWMQALLFAYEQIRQVEHYQELEIMAGVKAK